METFPTPHLEKLNAALNNDNLPVGDRSRLAKAIDKYNQWITELKAVDGTPDQVIKRMVELLNNYKNYIDIELVYDSDHDFLYRQKGQLKLDNSIIEEFLPWLIRPSVLPEFGQNLQVGPTKCFSAVYFTSTLSSSLPDGGLNIRTKNQDFAISRKLYLRASHNINFENAIQRDTCIPYVATEIKTNLDKTMFQEACATAHDVKTAVPGAKYFLLCEWLDMPPLSTAPTDIDEVLILRRAKRLSSNQRKHFNTTQNRKKRRDFYVNFLRENPLRTDIFHRFVGHIRGLLGDVEPAERDVLERGYF